MKVVAFNGSPKKEGNTYHAIKIVTDELEKQGIETEIVHVGNKVVRGCMACGQCAANKDEKCVLTGDDVNEWVQKIISADGILLGSPVHFAAMSGTMKSFLDRAFYVNGANGGLYRHKVGASLAAVRRSGGIPTYDQLNHYINYAEMLMPSSRYWNVIHGTSPGEVLQDLEGVQIMRVLGKNMAMLLKMRANGKNDVEIPAMEAGERTNFIR